MSRPQNFLPDQLQQFQSTPPRAALPQTAGVSAAAEVTSPRRALFRPTPISQNCPDPSPDRVTIARGGNQAVVLDLQRKFSNQLGFIPAAATLWYIESGNCGIAWENGEPCGMILGRPAFKYQPLLRPITQAAVYMDAQRRRHGLALLAALEARALTAGQLAMQCCCAEDLAANEFWSIAGFVPIDWITPENRRNRSIVVWRKQLTATLPTWFYDPPPRTGWKGRSTRHTP